MEPVDVYFNLTQKIWSIRSRKTGLVIGHSRVVVFPYGADLIVHPAGRARVLSTKVKTVHAFVRGDSPDLSRNCTEWQAFGRSMPKACRITYNPMRADHFTQVDSGARVDRLSAVFMIAPDGGAPEVWGVERNSLEA